MEKEYRYLVGGQWLSGSETVEVVEPFSGQVFARVSLAGTTHADEAVRKAYTAFSLTKRVPSHTRARLLVEIGNRIIARRQDFIETLVREAGRPLKDAREEVARAVQLFRVAGDAALRMGSRTSAADSARDGEGIVAFSQRFPLGPVLGIAGFSLPLLSAARKLAPAIASGNPVVLCPATETPVSALLLGEVLSTLEYPKEAVSILPVDREVLYHLIEHEGIKAISFTGSSEDGDAVRHRSHGKKLLLQMGGLGVAVVSSDADLERAAALCVEGAFRHAGQVDDSLQRILVHENVFYQFLGKFIKKTTALAVGDPALVSTEIGPVIGESAAIRIEGWIRDAVEQGGNLAAGGTRTGAMLPPTILLDATDDMLVCRKEVFGPVVAIAPFSDPEQPFWTVHDLDYGMRTSLFTNDLALVLRSFDALDVGTVTVNTSPLFRAESVDHGGRKRSSLGYESVDAAIAMMTEEKVLYMEMHR